VLRYHLRAGSGGEGIHCGGDGIAREYEMLRPATITVNSERRLRAPYGLHGGAAGLQGVNTGNHKPLRQAGLLTRDPRKVERKKPGQPGARKKFQFSKR